MVIYNNYQPLRSWLKKIKDINIIKSLSNAQRRKNRSGNTFMVLGANGYLGWATICQLVYKFGGCRIIAVDNNFQPKKSIITYKPIKKRINTLGNYFDFTSTIENADMSDYKICKNVLTKYKPDFVINLIDGNLSKNSVMQNLLKLVNTHLIISTKYNSKKKLKCKGKLTEFKTSKVIGLCNLITLIHPDLSTYNNPNDFFNKIIKNAYENKIIIYPVGNIQILSLEDFTRAIVKVIRKEQKVQSKIYYATERNLPIDRLVEVVRLTYTDLGVKVDTKSNRKVFNKSEVKEKRSFIGLIDKHRPPAIYMISYSCKNYLDCRRK